MTMDTISISSGTSTLALSRALRRSERILRTLLVVTRVELPSPAAHTTKRTEDKRRILTIRLLFILLSHTFDSIALTGLSTPTSLFDPYRTLKGKCGGL
jgi:hypothetical protein